MKEEQNASIWLIIIGIFQLSLNFLSWWWGVVLIGIGIIGLFYHSKKMLLVFGSLLIIAGSWNLFISIIEILLLEVNALSNSLWIILGGYQIYWGIKEIKIFKKVKKNDSSHI